MKIEIKILKKESHKVNKLGGSYYATPQYMTEGSAAMDLVCTEDVTIYPGETRMLSTGLSISIKDPNVVGILNCRSGLGTRGLVLANTIGLIDSDYQGELKISAWNRLVPSLKAMGYYGYHNRHNNEYNAIELEAGDRIAQLMFVPIIKAEWQVVEEFSSSTHRGEGGFGSTDL